MILKLILITIPILSPPPSPLQPLPTVRDKGLESSPEKAESHMVKCASVCVDRHIALLPGLKTKICNSIDQIKKG